MTPEELLDRLREALGPEIGGRAWEIVDDALSGTRLYWPRRIRRANQARAVYGMRSAGRSVTAIMAAMHLPRRQVERLYRAELMRLRTMRQSLPKKDDEAA